MKALLALALVLAAPCVRAADDKPAAASADQIDLVKLFIKSDVKSIAEKVPAGKIDEFLAIDPETLPAKLKEPYKGKRLEIYTAKQLAAGKKRGVFRMPPADCDIPKDAKSDDIKALKMAGYDEITPDEEDCVEKHSHCTQRDLMCEFTLQIVVQRKKKEKEVHLFFHQNDPMMAVVAECRAGVGGQTNFFGVLKPSCGH